MLDTSVRGWETSAWLDDDTFCVRAARTSGRHVDGQENEFVFCDPAPAALNSPGPPLLPGKPRPYIAPLDPQSKEIILIGATRGAITDVSVTMFGRTATAAVRPLPATDGRQIGAYAVWLPRTAPGRNDMKLTDITAVTGRDATGRVVTRLG
ncbi:hypothetical protein AB0368_28100 [Actinoplanes sp. NPDC051475]|uniref:hypothetical protein n=1 Tax=Actinoplanes sp. NPDC051475 TaxID=3157225 RepID=UPI00344F676B